MQGLPQAECQAFPETPCLHVPWIISSWLQGFQRLFLLPVPSSALTRDSFLPLPPSPCQFLVAAGLHPPLFPADWRASVFPLSASAPLNPASMHLIASRQSGCGCLIHFCSTPERTALYVTLLSLLQSCVGSFRS